LKINDIYHLEIAKMMHCLQLAQWQAATNVWWMLCPSYFSSHPPGKPPLINISCTQFQASMAKDNQVSTT